MMSWPPCSRLPRGFHRIDFFDSASGTITSVKTIDFSAPTYAGETSKFIYAVRGHVAALKGFTQGRRGASVAMPDRIRARTLLIGVPWNPTADLQRAMDSITIHAKNHGIELVWEAVP